MIRRINRPVPNPANDVILEKLQERIHAYDPDQPRDSNGKWGSDSNTSVANAIQDINEKFPQDPNNPAQRVLMSEGKPVVTFEIAPREGRLRLKTITATEPRSGAGSLVLRRLTRIADKHAVTMELTSSPYGEEKDRISHEKLQAWYQDHGFKPETGYDPALGYMIREPNKISADGAINWVSPNEPLGPDWYDAYVGYSPVPDDHPPSLKNPIITKIPTAQDGWKPGASKAARDQALTDLAEIHKRLRRQIGKPEVSQVGSMPSGPQNVANWPIGTGLSSSAAVIERLKRRIKAYSPDEERDDHGRWGSGDNAKVYEELRSKTTLSKDGGLLRHYFGLPKKTLSPEGIPDSVLINKYLRGEDKHTPGDGWSTPVSRAAARVQDDFTNSAIPAHTDFVTYRAITGHLPSTEDGLLTLPGFTSTTIDRSEVESYNKGKGVLITIHVSKGTPVVAANPTESEVLLNHNQEYKVVSSGKGTAVLETVPSTIKAYSPDEARDKTGKWTSDPGGEGHTTSHGETMVPAQRDTTGKRSLVNGDPLPKFLTKLRIPPAWTGVVVNTNPRGDLMAQGKDVKGRLQSIFSERHTKTASAKKFALIKALEAKADRIQAENIKNHKKDPDHSDAIALIMHTGIRPGSDKDTLADKQAYGATTLLGKHVVQDGDNVSLQFVGKKGVSLNIPITDSHVASMVTARAQTAGPNGKLFGEVTDDSLRDYTHTLDGGKFKPKDFRTLLANKMAVDAMGKVAEPTNLKEYKQAVKTVATAVSQKLGNTPAVALASYINPVVFSSWRGSAHV